MLLSQFLIGVYGGYFGAGIGILMLAAYGILGFSNIHQANAIKNLNGMFINGIAAAIFIYQGADPLADRDRDGRRVPFSAAMPVPAPPAAWARRTSAAW